ncbi:MAG: hypothetical protein IKF97_05555 [Clostridia bacterium]|nr:hypothetical protein [Clostridia bacterium]
MLQEIIKFLFYSGLIVIISKYILATSIRRLANYLKIKSKIVGDISGAVTSVPELLTITTSSLRGLYGASLFNILSSNIINLIQYIVTVIFNKNIKKLKNKAIKIDIILVIITILIPIFLLKLNIELNLSIVPLLLISYLLFVFLNNNTHKLYLNNELEENEDKIKNRDINIKKLVVDIFLLISSGVILYFIGELLGNSLENLCNIFYIPEWILGVLLGVITSIPEFITFFEAQKYHKKGENEMYGVIEATNNLFTSNVLNLFVIQTIGILIIGK